MIVACPECSKKFKLPENKLKPGGVRVKCTACETVFTVAPDQSSGDTQYMLHAPDGATLGPFPLETVRARIEVGEVGRDWRIQAGDGPAQAIVTFEGLGDVAWPETPAVPDGGAAVGAMDAGGGDEFGFDDDFGVGGDAGGGSGDADLGDADFGGGTAADAGLDFDDDFGVGGDAGGGSGDADLGDADFGGGAAADAGLDFDDDFGVGGDAAATDGKAQSDLDALFDEEPDLGAADHAPANAGADLDDSAFAFGDDEAQAGDDVFYDEDFDEDFADDVEKQVQAAAGAGSADTVAAGDFGGGDDFNFGDAAGGDDELITTLEQLSQTAPKRKLPILGAVLGVVATVAAVGAGMMFAPQALRNLPGLGSATLALHQALDSDFYQQGVINQAWDAVQARLKNWHPTSAAAVVEDLNKVLKSGRIQAAVHLAARLDFFASELAAGTPLGLPLPGDDAVVAAYRWAKQGGSTPPQIAPPDEALARGWRAYRETDVATALRELTAAVNGQPPEVAMMQHLAAARVYQDLNDLQQQVPHLREALRQQPGNLWLALRYAHAAWAAERPDQVLEVLPPLNSELAQLGKDEKARYFELIARAQIASGNANMALRSVSDGKRVVADDPLLQMLEARLLADENRWADAMLVIERAYKVRSDNPEVIIEYARALAGIGRPAEGLAVLQAAIKKQPSELSLRIAEMNQLVATNDLDAAELRYKEAARLAPGDAELARIGANLALARNDIEAATTRLSAYQENFPDDPMVMLKLAEINQQRGRLSEARRQLEALLEKWPQDASVRIQLGDILLETGDAQAAEEALLEAMRINSKNPRVYVMLGRAYMRQGKAADAEEYLTQAQKLGPGIWSVYSAQGDLRVSQGRIPEAIVLYEKAINMSNGATAVRMALAEAYEADNAPGRAVEQYHLILEREPNNLTALKRAAIGEFAIDNWDTALALFDRWVKLQPNNFEPYLYRGRVFLRQGEADAAIKALFSAAKRFPRVAELSSELGWAYLQNGDYNNAIRYLDHAAKIDSSNGRVQLRLGFYYKEKGRTQDAKHAFQRAQRLGGLTAEEQAEAKQALQALTY